MPALNYQPWKAEKVESGECMQTIRALRSRPFKIGDRLYHYLGMRTKACRKLGESVCTEAIPIAIDGFHISLAGELLGYIGALHIARGDGFRGLDAMIAWFEKTHGQPFTGQVIRWQEIET